MLDGGTKITEPGLYELSPEDYHGDICAGPSISSTGLRTIHEEGLEMFWAHSPMNPDRFEEKDREAFRFGEAAHLLLLEPERVMERVAVSKWATYQTKAAQEWRASVIEDGKLPIKPEDMKRLQAMRDALDRQPRVRGALSAGRAEQSLIWKDEETDVWLKARPDFLPSRNGRFVVDYKTTADLSRWSNKALLDWRYDIQAWLQIEGARRLCEIEPCGLLYIVQEKAPPYRVRLRAIFTADTDTTGVWARAIIQRGEMAGRSALRRYAEAIASGVWRDPDEELVALSDDCSEFVRNIIDREVSDV